MRVTRTLTIRTTGVLTVTVTADRPRFYVGRPFVYMVSWTPAAASVPPGCTASIDYGDGTSESRSGINTPWTPPSHSYTSTGTKTVTASVKDDLTGATGSASITVEVASVLDATLTADKTTGAIPLTVAFTFSMSGGFTPYTWTLDPGDGSTPYSNPTSPQSHTYNTVGTFTATLTVTDALGAGVAIATAILNVWEGLKTWWNARTLMEKAIIGISAISTTILIIQNLRR